MSGLRKKLSVPLVVVLSAIIASCAGSAVPRATPGGAAGSAPSGTQSEKPSPRPQKPEGPITLLDFAYIDEAGNMATAALDGNRSVPITTDAGRTVSYGEATWTPAGDRLAFSRSPSGGPYSVISVSDGAEEYEVLFESDRHPAIYMSFSPNGRFLALISEEGGGGLNLYVVDVEDPATEPIRVTTGRPLYWDWGADSETILVHTNGVGLGDGPGRIAVHDITREAQDAQALVVESPPSFFQAPATSPAGSEFAASVGLGDGAAGVAVFTQDGAISRLVARSFGLSAFAWSPDGTRLAVLDGRPAGGLGLVGTLSVYPEGENRRTISYQVQERTKPTDVTAFYWSPTGEYILYFSPYVARAPDSDQQRVFMRSGLYSPEDGAVLRLGSFPPAGDFVARAVPFFDQYSRSGSPWSPDGELFLLAVQGEAGPEIYGVRPNESSQEPVLLARGQSPVFPKAY